MSTIFHVEPLTRAEANLAFPLVRLAYPRRSLPEWRLLIRRLHSVRGDRGLMAVRDRRGLLHGLFSFRVERSVRYGSVLRIVDVIIAQMPGPSISEVMVDAGEDLCRRLHCDSLVIDMPLVQGSAPPMMAGPLPDRFKPDVIGFRSEPG